jgi:arylsulfatase A-like enzyme
LEEQTLAEALREGGYATASIGKWHLGDAPETWPEHHGFDLNIAGSGKGNPTSYFSPYALPNLPDGTPGEYLTDRLTDEAIRFIEENRNKPFFLYLPHYAVHTPLQAKGDLEEKYKAKAAFLKDQKRAEFLPDLGRPVRQVQNQPTYAAMIENMDEGVGRILEKIAALGLEKDTIVIFTSDNGGLSNAEGSPTSNLPLRGGKGWPYEGGVRVPLIVRWPGMTRAGSISAEPVISADLYPTILQMVGLSTSQQKTEDGVSFLPAIKGEDIPERPLFWHYPHYSNQGGAPNGAVRLGDWKLIE